MVTDRVGIKELLNMSLPSSGNYAFSRIWDNVMFFHEQWRKLYKTADCADWAESPNQVQRLIATIYSTVVYLGGWAC